ncbi:MAG: DUF58 domain-containing protein [Bacillus sp. (in: Bacteria)]|nr:DUF58 domain-containing protein [Bacillus sp. (in: firmicutes)]
MRWKREIIDDYYFHILSFLLFSIVATAGFLVANYIIFTIGVIGITYFFMHNWYFKHVGNKLYFDNQKENIRLLVDEEGYLRLSFRNEGVAILGATIRLTLKDVIRPTKMSADQYVSGTIEVPVPFSLLKKEETVIKIPILGVKRGTTRILELQINIPHLFGSGEVILTYSDIIQTQIYVFPSPAPFPARIEKKAIGLGEHPTINSLFVDRFQPIGTRDYIRGDRFQDIHWKTSARRQELQTKVFAPSTKMEWMFAINLSDGRHGVTSQLEDYIKYTTYLMQQALDKNISFSLVVNVRSFGSTPFLYLPSGSGPKHLQKALELLSIPSNNSMTIRFSIVLQYALLHQLVPAVFVQAGKTTDEDEKILYQYNHRGVQILTLQAFEDQGAIVPWQRSLKIASS